MEETASRAAVSPVTLYRHFPSKDAIVTDLVEACYDKLVSLAEAAQLMPPAQALSQLPVFLLTSESITSPQVGVRRCPVETDREHELIRWPETIAMFGHWVIAAI